MSARTDALDLSLRAVNRLRRTGVGNYMDWRDLQSIGALAIVESGESDEALCVWIARCAVLNALDANTVRERDRTPVNKGKVFDVRGEDVSEWEMWDFTVYGKGKLRPEESATDVWEILNVLSGREYSVVAMHFWDGLGQEKIAESLAVDQSTVSRVMASAKRKIREECIKRQSQLINDMRGEETRRAVLSGRTEDAR
jgi:RNA polymerase sigma factor (sigma-70 family)